MDNERWYEALESNIFTLVSHRIRKALTGKVSKTIKFTTEGQSDAVPYFPTCYIHELTPAESGNDLEGRTINAVIETIEVIVYADSKSDCKMITDEAVFQMKRLRFSVTAMPIITEDGRVSSGACRFRRVIGADDKDLTEMQ